jgi:hypothetical protein
MARDASGGGGSVVVVVVGEPAAQGGVAQLPEGAGLDLAHALAGQPEAAADLVERARGRVVEAVAGGKDGALAWGEGGQGGAHGGGKLLGLSHVVRAKGGGIGQEVAQGRGVGVAHGLVEGDGRGQGRGERVHTGAGDVQGGGEVGGGGRMAQGGVQGVGLAGEAGALILDIEGNVGEGDLDGQGAAERLLNPPDGVGGELVATRGIEEVDGAQEADGAFLHEVVEGEAAVLVPGGDGDDEAAVGGDEGGAGLGGGAEGVLVEGPGGEGGEQAGAGVSGEGAGQEGADGGGEGIRGKREVGAGRRGRRRRRRGRRQWEAAHGAGARPGDAGPAGGRGGRRGSRPLTRILERR